MLPLGENRLAMRATDCRKRRESKAKIHIDAKSLRAKYEVRSQERAFFSWKTQ
jgi:hypothetical protein